LAWGRGGFEVSWVVFLCVGSCVSSRWMAGCWMDAVGGCSSGWVVGSIFCFRELRFVSFYRSVRVTMLRSLRRMQSCNPRARDVHGTAMEGGAGPVVHSASKEGGAEESLIVQLLRVSNTS